MIRHDFALVLQTAKHRTEVRIRTLTAKDLLHKKVTIIGPAEGITCQLSDILTCGDRLAILAHEKGNDEPNQPHFSQYKDISTRASSMVDSRQSLNSISQDDGGLSRNSSLAYTSSSAFPSRASELSVDSKRSLQNSSSFGSNVDGSAHMRSTRSTQSLAGGFTDQLIHCSLALCFSSRPKTRNYDFKV